MSAHDTSHTVTTAQGALIAIDGQGVLTLWTQAAESLLGYSQDQVLGRHLSDLLTAPTAGLLAGPELAVEWAGLLDIKLSSRHDAVTLRPRP